MKNVKHYLRMWLDMPSHKRTELVSKYAFVLAGGSIISMILGLFTLVVFNIKIPVGIFFGVIILMIIGSLEIWGMIALHRAWKNKVVPAITEWAYRD